MLIRRVLERLAGMGSRSEPPSPGSDSARRYEVTVVGRTTDERDLLAPEPNVLPGVDFAVEEGRVVLRMTLPAADAATALQEGRGLAEDFFRVLGASYTGYMLDPYDDRDHITRLDASYVAVGPIPTADVAEGGVSEAGLAMIDPTGEARRQGKVLRLRARARVGHPIADDARRFLGRPEWSPRLRSALSLYWAGQCSPDRQVRFVLAMAALEVLAERPSHSLLSSALNDGQRRDLRRDLAALLTSRGLPVRDVERLVERLMTTHAVGATDALIGYMSRVLPEADPSLGKPSVAELRSWQKQRGSYLHAGTLPYSDESGRDKLNALVGEALRRELDAVATAVRADGPSHTGRRVFGRIQRPRGRSARRVD